MTLQDKLDAFRTNLESGGPPYNVPAAVHEIMHRATAELTESGAHLKALKVGDRAPAFELADANGTSYSSASLLSQGPLVLSFYRGFWCFYCNIELDALQDALIDIKARGATLLAISPQTAANNRRAEREKKLDFPILSDPGNALADAFGVRFTLPDYLVSLYRDGFSVDLPTVNGEPSWTLPMPARYVIGQSGIIAYAEVNPDYTRRPDPGELLPVLDRLRQHAAA